LNAYFCELFKNRDLKIPERDFKALIAQWQRIQLLKPESFNMPRGDFDIFLRNIPGDDYFEI